MGSVYEMVSDIIIRQLEETGIPPWRRPWITMSDGSGAYNYQTGKPYSLLNQMLLCEHGPGPYATFNQWNRAGAKVKKGQKGSVIVFWKWPEKEEEPSEDEPKKEKPILRYYHVFHASQVEGIDFEQVSSTRTHGEPIEAAEKVISDYISREKIKFEVGWHDQAFYSPTLDLIQVPCIDQYAEDHVEEYYSTTFHEMIHSTASPKRLKRKSFQTVSFRSDQYSREELVAEIGSCFLMHQLGISTDMSVKNSVAYINGWIKALSDDRYLFTSSSNQAEKAAQYIMQASSFC